MSKREKVMNILAKETGGKSYKAHKYSLDSSERPSVDYGNSEIVWKRRAETTAHRTYVDLGSLAKRLATRDDQVLSYFLDGSRRVFKVDDIAYAKSGGRSVIYPLSDEDEYDLDLVTDITEVSSLSAKDLNTLCTGIPA